MRSEDRSPGAAPRNALRSSFIASLSNVCIASAIAPSPCSVSTSNTRPIALASPSWWAISPSLLLGVATSKESEFGPPPQLCPPETSLLQKEGCTSGKNVGGAFEVVTQPGAVRLDYFHMP